MHVVRFHSAQLEVFSNYSVASSPQNSTRIVMFKKLFFQNLNFSFFPKTRDFLKMKMVDLQRNAYQKFFLAKRGFLSKIQSLLNEIGNFVLPRNPSPTIKAFFEFSFLSKLGWRKMSRPCLISLSQTELFGEINRKIVTFWKGSPRYDSVKVMLQFTLNPCS